MLGGTRRGSLASDDAEWSGRCLDRGRIAERVSSWKYYCRCSHERATLAQGLSLSSFHALTKLTTAGTIGIGSQSRHTHGRDRSHRFHLATCRNLLSFADKKPVLSKPRKLRSGLVTFCFPDSCVVQLVHLMDIGDMYLRDRDQTIDSRCQHGSPCLVSHASLTPFHNLRARTERTCLGAPDLFLFDGHCRLYLLRESMCEPISHAIRSGGVGGSSTEVVELYHRDLGTQAESMHLCSVFVLRIEQPTKIVSNFLCWKSAR